MTERQAPPQLYSFACSHRAAVILDSGVIASTRELATPSQRRTLSHAELATQMASQISWFTTLEEVTNTQAVPDPTCGLTDVMCNRFEFRFRALADQQIEPWSKMRMIWPAVVVATLESLTGAEPATWWIAGGPVKVVLANALCKEDVGPASPRGA